MRHLKFLHIIFITVLPFFSTAQNQNIRFEHIGIKDGLSSQSTGQVFQDHRGFLWIGTYFGLDRFDGIGCKVFYHKPNDSNSLVNNQVFRIAEDAQHNLWVSTQEGVSCFNPDKESFTNYSAKNKGNQYFAKANCNLFIDKHNRIWIGHNKGISFFDTIKRSFIDIPLQLSPPGKKINEFVADLLKDSKDRFWISTSYGIKKMDSHDSVIKEYRNNISYQQVVEDSKGRIFAGTWGYGVSIFDELHDDFQSVRLTDDSLSAWNTITSILPIILNGTDYLLLGTGDGLIRIKTEDLLNHRIVFESYIPDRLNNQSISNNSISLISIDKSANIWIGSLNGLNKIDPHNQYFQTFPLTSDLSYQWWASSMVEDFTNPDRIFVGSAKKIFSYKKSTQQFEIVSIPVSSLDLTDMVKGKKYYWLTTRNGLLQCDQQMKILKTYRNTNSVNSLITDRLYSVCEDHEGKVWIGTVKRGLNMLDPSTNSVQRLSFASAYKDNLDNSFITAIIEDSKYNIWLGSTAGLYRYNRSTQLLEEFKINKDRVVSFDMDNINSVKETRDGRIWIGSKQGLRYFDYATGSFTEVPMNDEKLSDYIHNIEEDGNGMLWLATNNGLIRYDPAAKKFNLYTVNNGLAENDLSNVFKRDQEGNIYIGLLGKMTVFNPQRVSPNTFVPPPVVTDITIDNSSVTDPNNANIRIRYNQSISFNFVSLNYTNSSANQYAYKLEGINKDWIHTGNNGVARFSTLSAGKYILKIKAANNEGIWNEETTDLRFIVTPPFWKTWWFISLVVLLVATGIYLLYRYRVNQLVQMEKMRTRIATDLHDDIGATLSSISFYSEAVKQKAREKIPEVESILDKMGETSRTMVNSMSDIVWAINPRNDDMGKMLDRMQSYAAELCALKNVILNVDADEKISHLKPRLEQRKNIYLIFKEALNNSLKYSGCRIITLALRYDNNLFTLLLKDDGKGFDTKTEFPGNGLQNMQRRAEEINGTLDIRSGFNEGTTIKITVKIT